MSREVVITHSLQVLERSSIIASKRERSVRRNFGVLELGSSPSGILVLITQVNKSMEVIGSLTVLEIMRVLRDAIATSLSCSSDIVVSNGDNKGTGHS